MLVDTNMECVLVMCSKDGKPELFGCRKGISLLLKLIHVYTKIVACTQFWGEYRVTGWCYYQQ